MGEFLSTAELAGQDFTSERNAALQVNKQGPHNPELVLCSCRFCRASFVHPVSGWSWIFHEDLRCEEKERLSTESLHEIFPISLQESLAGSGRDGVGGKRRQWRPEVNVSRPTRYGPHRRANRQSVMTIGRG